jgi:hypothetical protein
MYKCLVGGKQRRSRERAMSEFLFVLISRHHTQKQLLDSFHQLWFNLRPLCGLRSIT